MPQTFTDEQIAQLNQQLAEGKRTKQIADMVDAIYNDPQLGNEARALIKKKFPDVPIPDYDIEQKVNARFDADKKEREAEKKAQSDKEWDDRVKSQRKETQERFKLTDDAMKRLDDFMVEKNVGDYEVAATYFASKEPQPSNERGYSGHHWNHHNTDQFKEISADPEGWAREQIHQAVESEAQRERGMR